MTFDWTDHPDSNPKLGRFPLIIDPLVRTTRLTKALMDGSSGLNLMYLDTFKGLGLTPDKLQSSPHPFYGVVPGKHSAPLDGSPYRSPLGTQATTTQRCLHLKWSISLAPTISSWGGPATSSSWPSTVTHTSSLRFPGPLGSSLLRLRHDKCWTASRAALS
jgi:hypothetical protein